MRRPLRIAALAAALLPAGLAAQRGESAETLSDRRPPRRSCTVSREPQALPSLIALADSAGLGADLADFVRRRAIPADSAVHVLYSVRLGSVAGAQLRALESTLTPEAEAELTRLVGDALHGRGSSPSTFRLRVDLASEPRVRIGRSVSCPPEFTTRFRIQSIATVGGVQPRAVRVRLRVSAEGRVMNVVLLGNSGRPEYDRFLQESLLHRQIPPGTLDGEPVEMDLEQLIQFNARG